MDSLKVDIIIYNTDFRELLQDKNCHAAKQSHPALEKYTAKTTKEQMEGK